jgi:glycosyltransferase involved in cell wall biosynthesis
MVCVPSRNEPFCIVVLEAWDAGKPVIGTEAVHLISNFSTGIKAYIAPDSIAWCINYALANPKQSKSMGEKGNNLIKGLYNWNTVADEVVKLYEKLGT